MGKKGGGGGRRAGGGKKSGGGRKGNSAAKKINRAAKSATKHVSHTAHKANQGAKHVSRGARNHFNPMVFRFGKPLHRRIRSVSRFTSTHRHQPQYNNCRSGFCRYDNINAYSHRRYHRTHRYPVHYSSESAVTYDSLRATLPPNAANFCFVPLDDLTHYSATSPSSVALHRHLFALLYRPPIYPNPLPSTASADLRSLLEGFAMQLTDAEKSTPPGFAWPDWLACLGCRTTAAHREECLENTLLEVTASLNSSDMFTIRGIVATYVDIGDVLKGFAVEVLPILPSDKITNPHFVGEASPMQTEEVVAVTLQARAARGDDIDENEFDSVLTAAAEAISVSEPLDIAELPFTVTVPAGVSAGYTLTVQSPVGYLLNVTVPSDAFPGTTLLITPPSPENSAPTATVYEASESKGTEDAPPAYASILYTIPVDEMPARTDDVSLTTNDVAPLLMERV